MIYKNDDVIRSQGCGVHRRKPELIDEYEEDYHQLYIEQGSGTHPHMLSHFADLMQARLPNLDYTGQQFLDVGCSIGRALMIANMLGFNCHGFDVSQFAVNFCRKKGFDCQQAETFGGLYPDERFDVVHCSHVIEHVPDPVFLIGELYRITKPGGICMLACPNYRSLPRLMKGKEWKIWCLDSHLWQFSLKQMIHLFKSRGFECLSAKTLHGWVPTSKFKRQALDYAALAGYGDAMTCLFLKK